MAVVHGWCDVEGVVCRPIPEGGFTLVGFKGSEPDPKEPTEAEKIAQALERADRRMRARTEPAFRHKPTGCRPKDMAPASRSALLDVKDVYREVWGCDPPQMKPGEVIDDCKLCGQVSPVRWGLCADCRQPLTDEQCEEVMAEIPQRTAADLPPSVLEALERRRRVV